MKHTVSATKLKSGNTNISINETIDECPVCRIKIQPLIKTYDLNIEKKKCQVTYRCTNRDCQELFIGTYRLHSGTGEYTIYKIAPKTPLREDFPDSIKTISPLFDKIYNQAISAEAYELDQIVGIGLRKALEFLIKDYVSSENPEEKETIHKLFLGNCIEQYIEDSNIKACAKLASWLGNDETHYVRKWEDKDINDLKKLVKLTVNWIENVLLTKEYIEDMNPPKEAVN